MTKFVRSLDKIDQKVEKAERMLGKSQSELMQLKSMAERFEILVRTKNLSWRHHYEVSSIKQIEEDKSNPKNIMNFF